MGNLRRYVYFYQISWINNEDKVVFKNHDFFKRVFNNICSLEKFDEYWKSIEEYSELNYNNWVFGIISKIKTTDFPLKQNLENHNLSSLELNENEGLYHPTHFAIFKGTLLLFEYNFEGFRVNSTLKNKLNEYLKKHKIEGIKEVQIKPIIRSDLKKILMDSKVRDIQISIAPGKMDIFKETSDIGEMFSNINDFPDLTLNLGFSLGKRRSDKFYGKMDRIKSSFSNLLSEDKINSLEKFIIKVKTDEGIDSINLLDYIFKVNVEFLKIDDKSRAIDSKDAFISFKTIFSRYDMDLDDFLVGDLND